MQSQANSSEADRDRLMQAEEGWTKERLCLKKQLQDMQDELSRLKVLTESVVMQCCTCKHLPLCIPLSLC